MRAYQCPTDSCWIPVIPVDSSIVQRNENWQRAQPKLSFQVGNIPQEYHHSSMPTGMVPGMDRSGMGLEWKTGIGLILVIYLFNGSIRI